ncbi:MAG: DUF1385 domain-containing protein [Oscillospiraceae bacterium]
MQKERFKSKIGGQALIEGIAMRGPEQTCLAVRLPSGEIHTEMHNTPKNPVRNIPLVRGAVAMILSLKEGYKFLMKAADYAYPDENDESKMDEKAKKKKKNENSWLGVASGVLGGMLSIALFMVVPTVITGLLAKVLPIDGFKSVIEGALKIVVFILYLFLVTRMKEIHRVFEYHGAEHKTIACYEHGEEMTVENVRKYSRFHPRCGTSFLFIVIIISILIFTFIPWGSTIGRVGLKLLLLPLVMGISYEIIQYAGSHENLLCRFLSAPGLWVQRLTAFEPDDSEIEVAIASLMPVIPQGGEQL